MVMTTKLPKSQKRCFKTLQSTCSGFLTSTSAFIRISSPLNWAKTTVAVLSSWARWSAQMYQRRLILVFIQPSYKHRFTRLQLSIWPMMVHLARARNQHHGLLKLTVLMRSLEAAKSGYNVLMDATSVPMVARALFLNGTKNELSEHCGFWTFKVSFKLKLKSKSSHLITVVTSQWFATTYQQEVGVVVKMWRASTRTVPEIVEMPIGCFGHRTMRVSLVLLKNKNLLSLKRLLDAKMSSLEARKVHLLSTLIKTESYMLSPLILARKSGRTRSMKKKLVWTSVRTLATTTQPIMDMKRNKFRSRRVSS